MISADNKAKLAGFRADLVGLEAKLAELDVQREDTRKQIEHLRRIIGNLAALCGESYEEDLSLLGFTDACRVILRDAHPSWINAADLRDGLSKRGYDLQPYSNPLASIYTILKRLVDAQQAEKREEGFQTFYRWIKRQRVKGLPFLTSRRFAGQTKSTPNPFEGSMPLLSDLMKKK